MTVADRERAHVRIDRALTQAILRGDHAPGTHLPTLRELAALFDVNQSTVQRALARLESRGLVTARQGSGLMVNDPYVVGDLSLIPDWLEVLADDPDRSADVLSEVLEVRRVMIGRYLAAHRVAALEAIDGVLSGAVRLPPLAGDEPWRVESAVVRTVLRATGNMALLAFQSTFDRALEQLPELTDALYVDPEHLAWVMLAVVDELRTGGADLADRIEAVIEAADVDSVERYRRRLEARRRA